MSDSIRVNGNELSSGSIVIKCEGERYFGFTEISFGHKRERGKRMGMERSGAPRARSRGTYTPDNVKVKGPVASFKAVRSQLASLGPDGVTYGDSEVSIEVSGEELDQTINLQFLRCVIAGETGTWSTGVEGLEEEVEFDCMQIVRDGLTLFQSEPV